MQAIQRGIFPLVKHSGNVLSRAHMQGTCPAIAMVDADACRPPAPGDTVTLMMQQLPVIFLNFDAMQGHSEFFYEERGVSKLRGAFFKSIAEGDRTFSMWFRDHTIRDSGSLITPVPHQCVLELSDDSGAEECEFFRHAVAPQVAKKEDRTTPKSVQGAPTEEPATKAGEGGLHRNGEGERESASLWACVQPTRVSLGNKGRKDLDFDAAHTDASGQTLRATLDTHAHPPPLQDASEHEAALPASPAPALPRMSVSGEPAAQPPTAGSGRCEGCWLRSRC